ncbi:MAG: DivIVA domain-containing protein [Oscillospiraceae bacterium]
MFTPREIRDTEFERIVRGYNPEDVDGFLSQIADQIEQLETDKAASEKKLMLLAEKVDEMREDEGRLRSVLISAEKMKEGIIGDAQHQAEALYSEAKQRAEMLVTEAQNRYDSVIGEITAKAAQEEENLTSLKTQVASFKNNVLAIYKQHLEIFKEIPDYDVDIEAEPETEDSLQTGDLGAEQTEQEAAQVHMENMPVMNSIEPLDTKPAGSGAASFSFGEFGKTEPSYRPSAPAVKLNEVKPAASESSFSAFMADDDANSRFGKLDFGESFTFGKE